MTRPQPISQPSPAIGTRARCRHCGRTVWWRLAGTTGTLGDHPNHAVYQWRARTGTKPRPLRCPTTHVVHSVAGYPDAVFIPPGEEHP